MKKLIIFLLLVVLMVPVMATDETATVTLKATIAETAKNSGIRVKAGNLDGVTTNIMFDTLFASAHDAITVAPAQDISLGDATGYFTVMVRRATDTPAEVTVTGTPLVSVTTPYYYLGYKIYRGTEVVIDTTASPTTSPESIIYTADGAMEDKQIRDVSVFRYEVPQNVSVPFGEYTANISYMITIL